MGLLRADRFRHLLNSKPIRVMPGSRCTSPWASLASFAFLAVAFSANATTTAQVTDQQVAPSSAANSSDLVTAPPSEIEYGKILFEPHIREILSAHCIECHGAKQPKGGFRVDDRDTLLGYLTPGDLAASSLWTDYLVTTDEELHMPPLKKGVPLSQFELAAIRVWIEDGADWPEGVVWPAEQEEEIKLEPQPVLSSEKNVLQKAITFSGFFHPAIVHFPIGLLLVSGFFAIMAFLKRDTFEAAAFHCLWIGALGAIASCIAGWSYADMKGYAFSNDAVMRHRICGIAVAVIAVVLTPIAMAARRREKSPWRYVWAGGALCLALLVSIAGHQGGELTYGEDLFNRAYEQAFGK